MITGKVETENGSYHRSSPSQRLERQFFHLISSKEEGVLENSSSSFTNKKEEENKWSRKAKTLIRAQLIRSTEKTP